MLTKTPLHDQIAEKLAGREPDWFTVCAQFLKSRPYHHLQMCLRQGEDLPISRFAGQFAELHLRQSLEEICNELGMGNRVVFDALRPGLRSKNFEFCTDKAGSLYTKYADSDTYYSEIDEIMLIDNIPTLFEVRIKSPKNKGSRHGGSKHGNAYNMTQPRVDYLLEPLKDYFRTEKASFVFIIPPDQIHENSPVQKEFKKRGGILLPFYKDRYAYQDEVKNVLDYMSINHKKPSKEAP